MQFNELKNKFVYTLKSKKIRLCLAESITGGLLSSELIKLKGASSFIDYSLVTYSNRSKEKVLKFNDEINKYGVVSREIAKLMVKNVRNFSDYNNLLSISCTGYASKNEDKDCILGLVYIGVMYNDIIKVHKKNFQERDRTKIIRLTVENMIKFSLNLIT
ncbi:MAG: Nicotinamide-nucleotide amidohydrolase PncC [Alphaproteobacteria bacterium MarineAlpha8_Bin1]|nr:MAG: Nicotinamide-nucleotide amidohydrolase PncC [Alphaproteobacteria bacterium MarineAlpha8_Bin1]|tara:strand:- start:2009 stop:2488 length:480 start_codon:yes stop_codon:yes gene_type:complete